MSGEVGDDEGDDECLCPKAVSATVVSEPFLNTSVSCNQPRSRHSVATSSS